jgi:hypothetical protein
MTSIPKVVHYCWFGGRPKPRKVQTLLAGWREVLPDYEIREWNEMNFDVSARRYAYEAYNSNKYAFVSDVARLYALYECGGIYLDTDVEVLRPFDELLDGPVVLGFEESNFVATSTMIAGRGSRLIGDFLRSYDERTFLSPEGKPDQNTNVRMLTSMLYAAGLRQDGQWQELQWFGEKVIVLEQVKLSPLDYPNGVDKRDSTTITVHHFDMSWQSSFVGRAKAALRKGLIGAIGGSNVRRLRRLLTQAGRSLSAAARPTE